MIGRFILCRRFAIDLLKVSSESSMIIFNEISHGFEDTVSNCFTISILIDR